MGVVCNVHTPYFREYNFTYINLLKTPPYENKLYPKQWKACTCNVFFSILTYLFHRWDTMFILKKKKKDSLRFINDLIVHKALQSVKWWVSGTYSCQNFEWIKISNVLWKELPVSQRLSSWMYTDPNTWNYNKLWFSQCMYNLMIV